MRDQGLLFCAILASFSFSNLTTADEIHCDHELRSMSWEQLESTISAQLAAGAGGDTNGDGSYVFCFEPGFRANWSGAGSRTLLLNSPGDARVVLQGNAQSPAEISSTGGPLAIVAGGESINYKFEINHLRASSLKIRMARSFDGKIHNVILEPNHVETYFGAIHAEPIHAHYGKLEVSNTEIRTHATLAKNIYLEKTAADLRDVRIRSTGDRSTGIWVFRTSPAGKSRFHNLDVVMGAPASNGRPASGDGADGIFFQRYAEVESIVRSKVKVHAGDGQVEGSTYQHATGISFSNDVVPLPGQAQNPIRVDKIRGLDVDIRGVKGGIGFYAHNSLFGSIKSMRVRACVPGTFLSHAIRLISSSVQDVSRLYAECSGSGSALKISGQYVDRDQQGNIIGVRHGIRSLRYFKVKKSYDPSLLHHRQWGYALDVGGPQGQTPLIGSIRRWTIEDMPNHPGHYSNFCIGARSEGLDFSQMIGQVGAGRCVDAN